MTSAQEGEKAYETAVKSDTDLSTIDNSIQKFNSSLRKLERALEFEYQKNEEHRKEQIWLKKVLEEYLDLEGKLNSDFSKARKDFLDSYNKYTDPSMNELKKIELQYQDLLRKQDEINVKEKQLDKDLENRGRRELEQQVPLNVSPIVEQQKINLQQPQEEKFQIEQQKIRLQQQQEEQFQRNLREDDLRESKDRVKQLEKKLEEQQARDESQTKGDGKGTTTFFTPGKMIGGSLILIGIIGAIGYALKEAEEMPEKKNPKKVDSTKPFVRGLPSPRHAH